MGMLEPRIDGFAIITLFAIGHAFLLILILITKKQLNRTASIYLATILGLFAFRLTHHFLLYSRYIIRFPAIFGFGQISLFAIGPLLFLYVQSTIQKRAFRWTDLLHFIPFVLYNIYRSPFYLLSNKEKLEKVTYFYENYLNKPPGPDLSFVGEIFLWDFHPMLYSFLTLSLLVKHDKHIKNHFSYNEKINWGWLKHIFAGYIVFSMLQILTFIGLAYAYNTLSPEFYWAYYTVILSGFVFAIAYKGQFTTIEPVVIEYTTPDQRHRPAVPIKKYRTSPLTNQDSQTQLSHLKKSMEQHAPYLNPKLTLPQLAEQLDINANYLSQVINQELDLNFYDFVNQYRVDAAKEILNSEKAQTFTLEAIAEEVGFNSRSAFNRAFKKFTQMTPSQYRKHQVSKT